MTPELAANYLDNSRYLFRYYKGLADKALAQLDPIHINEKLHREDNSIALIVKHMSGNMLSRWTDFLTSDGEKSWRHRDTEFEGDYENMDALLAAWEKGWNCLFSAVDPLVPEDLGRIVYIRNEGHTVMEAINRQVAHYAHHVGQILFLAKHFCGENWQSLSIPKGRSIQFNDDKFGKEKHPREFL